MKRAGFVIGLALAGCQQSPPDRSGEIELLDERVSALEERQERLTNMVNATANLSMATRAVQKADASVAATQPRYRMIMVLANGNSVATDFSSRAKCLSAASQIVAEREEASERQRAEVEAQGGRIVIAARAAAPTCIEL